MGGFLLGDFELWLNDENLTRYHRDHFHSPQDDGKAQEKTSGMMLYVIFDVSSCGARSRQVCFKKVD